MSGSELSEEVFKAADEWLAKNRVMTEAERKQSERVMEAFRKTLSKSSPLHPFTRPADWLHRANK